MIKKGYDWKKIKSPERFLSTTSTERRSQPRQSIDYSAVELSLYMTISKDFPDTWKNVANHMDNWNGPMVSECGRTVIYYEWYNQDAFQNIAP